MTELQSVGVNAVIYLMGNLHEQAKAIVAAVNDMSVFHA